MQTLALSPHPATPDAAVRAIGVRVEQGPHAFCVRYRIEGDVARLRIPSPRPPARGERLWQHTCCEMFVARKGAAAYHEFNFSPSGEWAAYAFSDYRTGGAPHATKAPRIALRSSGNELELDASVAWQRSGSLLIALSAVIEHADGSLSYWALRHPAEKPDFHHRQAFALELE
jgi:hypothetical protein